METSTWTSARATAWYADQPWWQGCNYLPSTAVNGVEMWQAESFDPKTIARELGWAAEYGFNSVRIFLSQVVWIADPAGMRSRLDQFLTLAAERGISVMPTLFDDCNFAKRDPQVGPQPPPVPGITNSGWVPSQPLAMVDDRAAWPALERYVLDVVSAFRSDKRISIWDIYNEPGNTDLGNRSLGLLEHAFAWARSANPDQPLTVGVWNFDLTMLAAASLRLSDVTSFHCYENYDRTLLRITNLPTDRPLFCTEWMTRTGGSTFISHLPLWKRRRIGCWCWGLVAGRTQTYYSFSSLRGAPEPDVWSHDLLRTDGRPWCPEEAAFVKRFCKPASA